MAQTTLTTSYWCVWRVGVGVRECFCEYVWVCACVCENVCEFVYVCVSVARRHLTPHALGNYGRNKYSSCSLILLYWPSGVRWCGQEQIHHGGEGGGMFNKVCQMLSWWTKFHFIPSIPERMSQKWYHCIHKTRRHLMSLTSAGLVSARLCFLSMLFILEMVCTAYHLQNKQHAQISQFCGKLCWKCEIELIRWRLVYST